MGDLQSTSPMGFRPVRGSFGAPDGPFSLNPGGEKDSCDRLFGAPGGGFSIIRRNQPPEFRFHRTPDRSTRPSAQTPRHGKSLFLDKGLKSTPPRPGLDLDERIPG